jgi:hypothetical protein
MLVPWLTAREQQEVMITMRTMWLKLGTAGLSALGALIATISDILANGSQPTHAGFTAMGDALAVLSQGLLGVTAALLLVILVSSVLAIANKTPPRR